MRGRRRITSQEACRREPSGELASVGELVVGGLAVEEPLGELAHGEQWIHDGRALPLAPTARPPTQSWGATTSLPTDRGVAAAGSTHPRHGEERWSVRGPRPDARAQMVVDTDGERQSKMGTDVSDSSASGSRTERSGSPAPDSVTEGIGLPMPDSRRWET
jgi:hypothetical protein